MSRVDNLSQPYLLPARLKSSEFQRRIITVLAISAGLLITLVGSAVIGKTDYGIFVVGGLLGLAAGTLIAMRPEYGLYVLLAFIYSNASAILEDNFGVPDSNKLLVGLIFVGTLTGRLILERKPFIFRLTEISVLAFGLVITISLFASKHQEEALKTVLDWAKDFAILVIVVQLCTSEKVFKRGIWILILTAAVLSALGLFQVLTGNFKNTFFGFATSPVHEITEGYDSNRVSGPIGDPNFYGLILVAIFPSAVYRAMTERRWEVRLLGLVCAFLILLSIFFTYSRGTFLTLLVSGFLIVRERKMNIYKVGAIVGIIFVAVSPFLPKGFWDRIGTLTGVFTGGSQQTESSFRGRTSEIMVGLDMFYDYPLLGVGNGNYEINYLNYSEKIGLDDRLENRQAHSLYVEIAAEEGIVGVIVFGVMLYFMYMSTRTAKLDAGGLKRDDLIPWISGLQIGIVAYLTASIFLHGDYFRYFWLLAAFAVASSVMVHEQVILKKEQLVRDRALKPIVKSKSPKLAEGARKQLPAGSSR